MASSTESHSDNSQEQFLEVPKPCDDENPRPKPKNLRAVPHLQFPFLKPCDITNVPKEDINYLHNQGCFSFPPREIVNILDEKYFLHVHPLLPLVPEGDFWDMYQGSNNRDIKSAYLRMSLLVFRALLFVACNVSLQLRSTTMKVLMLRSLFRLRRCNPWAIPLYELQEQTFTGKPR